MGPEEADLPIHVEDNFPEFLRNLSKEDQEHCWRPLFPGDHQGVSTPTPSPNMLLPGRAVWRRCMRSTLLIARLSNVLLNNDSIGKLDPGAI
jgi:hypothetical protein